MTPHAPDEGAPRPDRIGRIMAWWYRMLAAHRVWLLVVLSVLAGAFSWASTGIHWQADILLFFSGDSTEVSNVRHAVGPGLANDLRLDVHRLDGQAIDLPSVRVAVDDLAGRLDRMQAFVSVWTGLDSQRAADAYVSLIGQAATVIDDADLSTIQGRISADYLNRRCAETASTLVDPDGELRLRQLQSDPLDLAGIINGRLARLAPAQGAHIENGLLISADGRHVMMITQPKSLPSDTAAASLMLEELQQTLRGFKQTYPDLGVWVIGPHRGYAENAERIKRDVALITGLGTLAVAVAIWLYFRRWSAVLLCIVPPALGMSVALGLAGAFHAGLPVIVLGFGGLLCGSTTDYGIQLIAALNRRRMAGRTWDASEAGSVARELLGPISMSVATSVTGFAALGVSASPGLRALGLFVALATFCIWLVTFLVLPVFLGPWVLGREPSPAQVAGLGKYRAARWMLIAFLATAGWLTYNAMHVQSNHDPRSLDGASTQFWQDHTAFFQAWGDLRNRALCLVEDASPDAALDTLHRVHDFLAGQEAEGMIAGTLSASTILPDKQSAEAAARRWQGFWTSDRRAALRDGLAAAARVNGFKPEAWDAYLAQLAGAPQLLPAAERIARSPAGLFPGLIHVESGLTTLATIVEMRSDRSLRMATAWAGELRLRFPQVTIVSGNLLMFDATERARAEAESLAPWAILAIILPLWVYFRRIGLAMLATLCLLVGFLWVVGAAEAFAGGLNLLSLVPVLFTLGVAVDYGIYAVSDPANRGQMPVSGNRSSATFLCAMTTLLGTGAMIVASHPVLRWLGLTLIAGISGGYLMSALVVGPIARWLHRPGGTGRISWWWRWGLRVVRLALVGCVLLLAISPAAEWILARQRPAEVQPLPAWPLIQTAAERWEVGPAWMRRRGGIWEMSVRGSPEEIGYSSAILGRPLDLRIENEMLDRLDVLLPQSWSRWLVLRGVAVNLLDLPSYIAPEYQRELYAIAQAAPDPYRYLAPTYPRLLDYHALHDVSQMLIDNPLVDAPPVACTGVVADPGYSGDGHLWLARNFDFEAGESFGRQKSVTYVHPREGEGLAFASVSWPCFTGCVTGMNEARLALFINAAATKDFRRIGNPTVLVARDILQHARTLEEAYDILRRAQVFVSDIMVIADGKTGEAMVVEKSPVDTARYAIEGSTVVANHLTTPRFAADPANEYRIRNSTTMQRYARARELLNGLKARVTAPALASLLRDKKGAGDVDLGLGNRNSVDALIACHSVIMDVTAGRLWVAAWPNAEGRFVAIDIMAMLANRDPTGDVSSEDVAADPIMSDGRWELFVKCSTACQDGEAALRRRQFAAAQAAGELAIGANPRFFQGYEILGRAQLGLGQRSAAGASLRRAMELQPPYASQRAALERLIAECGK